MILVIIAISILFIAAGSLLFASDIFDYDTEFIPGVIGTVGILGLVISLIATIVLGIGVSNLSVIDDKIAMYQEENTKIEQQISAAVESYQKYETDIFTEVKSDSAISLVALYPELKSDTLVQKQIEVYLANNDKIKELKEEQITGNVKRWWLYFGGKEKKS